MKSGSRLRTIAIVLIGFVAIASILTFPHSSQGAAAPLLAGARVSPQVMATLMRSCQDCHSEATHYPWYSYVAPISWLINRDVQRGRERLNFSKWHEYSVIQRERHLSDIANQVQDRGMPLSIYTLVHRDAKLSAADIEAIFQWTQEERTRLIAESISGKE